MTPLSPQLGSSTAKPANDSRSPLRETAEQGFDQVMAESQPLNLAATTLNLLGQAQWRPEGLTAQVEAKPEANEADPADPQVRESKHTEAKDAEGPKRGQMSEERPTPVAQKPQNTDESTDIAAAIKRARGDASKTELPNAIKATSLTPTAFEQGLQVVQQRLTAATQAANPALGNTLAMPEPATPAPVLQPTPAPASESARLEATPESKLLAARVEGTLVPTLQANKARGGELAVKSVAAQQAQFIKALGEKFELMIKNQQGEAKIRLDPPNLGVLEIKVQQQGDQAKITVVSADARVRDALESTAHRLRDQLSDSGIVLDRFDVMSDSGSQPGQQEGRQEESLEVPFTLEEAPASFVDALKGIDQHV